MFLSIIIPSYNHEKFVLSTIRAAESIDVPEKEIIVIDDGSKDASVSIIRDYIAQSGSTCIRFIARENRGVVRTLNEGLSIAQGRYLYAVGSDDIPIPEGIAQLLDLLEGNPGMQFAMGNALVMYSEAQRSFKLTYGAEHDRFFATPSAHRRKEMFFNYPNPLLLQASVFRTATLRGIGGWRSDIVLDDVPLFFALFLRYSNENGDYSFHSEIMACLYRQHHNNNYRNVGRQFAMTREMFTKLCPLEWRNDAIAKTAAHYSLIAMRGRNMREARHLLHSLIEYAGALRSIGILSQELYKALISKLSKALAGKNLLITYALPTVKME